MIFTNGSFSYCGALVDWCLCIGTVLWALPNKSIFHTAREFSMLSHKGSVCLLKLCMHCSICNVLTCSLLTLHNKNLQYSTCYSPLYYTVVSRVISIFRYNTIHSLSFKSLESFHRMIVSGSKPTVDSKLNSRKG